MSGSLAFTAGKVFSDRIEVTKLYALNRDTRREFNFYSGLRDVEAYSIKSNGFSIDYTGSMDVSTQSIGGVSYRVYKLITSGKLKISGGPFKIWMCGGGSDGEDAPSSDRGGRGGAGGYTASGVIRNGEYDVTIGQANKKTVIKRAERIEFSTRSTIVGNPDGGSGGGAGGNDDRFGHGMGDDVIPFGELDDGYCAGGGGGYKNDDGGALYGGIGGSMGVDGQTGGPYDEEFEGTYGSGGIQGGGLGANGSELAEKNGLDATFYGGGGGGGAAYFGERGKGGKGYQGIAIIIVPKEIAEAVGT